MVRTDCAYSNNPNTNAVYYTPVQRATEASSPAKLGKYGKQNRDETLDLTSKFLMLLNETLDTPLVSPPRT